MASGPLIKNLNIQGGTFYAFSSAARDFTKIKANENLKLEFSKFVCLNIPNISKLDFATFGHYENYVQLETIDGTLFNGGLTGDPNVDLIQSFQNYVLNMEALVLSDTDYDASSKKSTSERIFFKWLKEIGAIRFREATSTEVNTNIGAPRFVEEDENLTGTTRYQKVVTYIGELDVMNSVELAGETYTEVYIRIPTLVGNTPMVLFDALSDTNYKPNLIITGSGEYLQGRTSGTIHPDGLSINAFYDYDASVDYTDPNANWHNESISGGNVNSYFTELNSFTDPTNVNIKKYYDDYVAGQSGGVAYKRSKLDGISVDFEPESYYDIINDSNIQNIQQYNSMAKSKNFEFNAVLIYYDIFDATQVLDRATNLYGILFLDNVKSTSDGGYIPRFKKYKPNEITKLNGNSYGLSLNTKQDVSIEQGGVFTIVNEYNNFSMGLFSEATAKLQEASVILTNGILELGDLKIRVTDLENTSYALDSIQTLETRIEDLQTQLNNAQLAFASSTTLLDLIAANSDEIQNIISGNLSINLTYNTNVLQSGKGVRLDKSVPNRVIINNVNQEYNIVIPYDINDKEISAEFNHELDLNRSDIRVYFELLEFTNMCRLYTINTALNTLKIYINDANRSFEKGQIIKFVFPTELLLQEYSIEIYTDKANVFGNGQYGLKIATISYLDLLSARPIFELICLNSQSYTFDVDIIR